MHDFYTILLVFLFMNYCTALSNIDSDSPNYDSMYDTLVAEYEEGLHSTTEPMPTEDPIMVGYVMVYAYIPIHS